MKKLLLLTVIAFMFGSFTEANAGYALFQQRKMLLDKKLKSLELQKEYREQKGVKDEAIEEEIRRLDEEIKKLEGLEELENRISGDVTPKFNGIG